ncbi:MAG: GNAT family N-acetyltransferase [Cyanothece sp. SIO1E1]|nr:GNAT family N-acetyltransferase [Cyanothece sp. SIO1E1]
MSTSPIEGSSPPAFGSHKQPLYLIRTIRPQDLDSLSQLLADSFHPQAGLMRWFYPVLRMGIYEDLQNRMRSHPENYVCLTAVNCNHRVSEGHPSDAGNYLVGTVEMALRMAYPWQPRNSQRLYLSNLAVRTECRRQGIAQQLLSNCEQIAQEWGFKDLYLYVLENNFKAQRLYYRAGYHLDRIETGLKSWVLAQPRRFLLHKHLCEHGKNHQNLVIKP